MPDQAIAHVEGVVTDPSMRFIRRPEAARYLKDKYGFGASRTLAKGVVTGDTPVFHKAGRIVLYTREALDAWALAKISVSVRRRPPCCEGVRREGCDL
jgi:hypothetical protein